MIKIIVADDHNIFAESLSQSLSKIPSVEIIFIANNGSEIIDFLNTGKIPSIVILDLEMPILDGRSTLKILNQDFPQIKTIILSSDFDEDTIVWCLTNGADCIVPKTVNFEKLSETINLLYHGTYCLDNYCGNLLFNSLNTVKKRKSNLTLTQRQKEIIHLTSQEFTSKEIADKLSIQTKTVEAHKSRIAKLLNVRGSIGIAIFGKQTLSKKK